MYAVVRIRGTVNVSPKVEKTLEMLNLRRANNASVWPEDNSAKRMLKSVEHMITFGVVNDDVLKLLIEKKGRAIEGKIDSKKAFEELKKGKTMQEAGVVNCFTLSPPKGGFERKGVKLPYSIGGVYGDRKEKISELLKKMI